MKILPVVLVVAGVGLATVAMTGTGERETASVPQPGGEVIARVGDQQITFNQVNTMLNSSAVVGVSIPDTTSVSSSCSGVKWVCIVRSCSPLRRTGGPD